MSYFGVIIITTRLENAGLTDEEKEKENSQKEESQEESCVPDEVIDYEQPSEEMESQVSSSTEMEAVVEVVIFYLTEK